MNRRTVLAGGVVAVQTALTGCGQILGETVTLDSPDRQRRPSDDGVTKALIYRYEGARIVTVGIEQRRAQERPTSEFPIEISVPHSQQTTVDSLHFDFRTPVDAGDVPATLYLQSPPNSTWPPLSIEKTDDGWIRVDFGEIGELGEGTVGFQTIVSPVDPVSTLRIRGEVVLSTASAPPGRKYRIRPRTELSLVTR